jgi:DNA polymerase III epsilon subunit-like protein
MIDTETTNDIDDPIVYDVGYEVFDLFGNSYEKGSLVNKDIFLDKELMSFAYYAEKVPTYWKQIWAKEREMLSWDKIKWRIFDVCKRNNCRIISAHNARFDNRSLNLTQRYITTSRWRYFLPFGVEWWDTLKMCREIFGGDEAYKIWCFEHGFVTKTNQAQMTAEVVYKYITGNIDFVESHTALEDVEIEKDIFLYCWLQNPEIDGRLWAK